MGMIVSSHLPFVVVFFLVINHAIQAGQAIDPPNRARSDQLSFIHELRQHRLLHLIERLQPASLDLPIGDHPYYPVGNSPSDTLLLRGHRRANTVHLLRYHRRRRRQFLPQAGPRRLQLRRKRGILLLDLDLCACRLGVAQRIDKLALCARQVRRPLEILERLGHLALLEEELGHCRNGNIAFGIDW